MGNTFKDGNEEKLFSDIIVIFWYQYGNIVKF